MGPNSRSALRKDLKNSSFSAQNKLRSLFAKHLAQALTCIVSYTCAGEQAHLAGFH